MQLRFDGKTAIVTGGARGIGFSIVEELASSGASVVILDVNADGVRAAVAGITDNGGVAIGCAADVTDLTATTEATHEAVGRTGGLDIVVNCAGRAAPGLFQDGDPETWRMLIEVNLLGTVHVCYAAIPHLIERGSGRIINIASDAARIGSAGEAVYSAAKGGVISLTKSLARELARHRISVNCVSPGPTETPMLRESGAEAPGVVEKLIKATPLRRLGRPEDVASAVVYLASDHASHITGQVLSVSGGLTMV
jgi:2-hydroxycyclohexanecarboxyl-CoA dehydrogenase